MAFGPADRDGTNQNKDRTWKGPSVKLWVTAPAATFPLSPVHQTGITIINVNSVCAVGAADVFLEIVMQPFLGFDDIVPDSSSPATV